MSFAKELVEIAPSLALPDAAEQVTRALGGPCGHRKELEDKVRIYFVRHGQSEANILRVFSNSGFRHLLTDIGVKQATDLAHFLKSISFAKVYSSPIARAIQTTEILTDVLGIDSFEVNEALREYDVGRLEGQSDDASWQKYTDTLDLWEHDKNLDLRTEGGESLREIQERVAAFVSDKLRRHPSVDENILVVSHGGLFLTALPALLENVSYSFAKQNPLGNSKVIVVSASDGRFWAERWGDIVLAR